MLKKSEQVLFFLSVLFLPTQLGRHFWQPFSYIYSLPVDYLSPTIYFWDLLVVLLILISFFQKKAFNKTAINLLLFFLLTQLISLLPSFYEINIGAGLVRFEQYFIAGLFGVYIASLKKEQLFASITTPLLLSLVIEAVLAISQFVKSETLGLWIIGERSFTISTPAIAKFDFYDLQFLRPYGTFPHPNVLAAFMIIGLIIASIRIKSSIWSSIIGVLVSLSVVLTFSRVALVVGFISASLLLKKNWRIFLITSVMVLSPLILTRLFTLFNFDDLSLIRRQELVEGSFFMFLNQPFFGVGVNNFISYGASQLITGPTRFLQPVHNIFLLTLSETGLLGFLGLILLAGFPVWQIFKHKLFDREGKILLMVWVIIFSLGMFDHYFLTLPQGYRLLFLVWGLSLVIAFHPYSE